MATSVTPIARARSIRRAREAARAADRNSVLLLLPVITLLVVGLGAILSASSVIARIEQGDQFFYFKRQVVYAVLGLGVLIVATRIPYRLYKRFSGLIFAIAMAGLVATLAMGTVRGGSRRWIEVGSVTVQASEFAKFAVVVFLAAALSRKEEYLGRFLHFFWPVAGSLGLTAGLLMAERLPQYRMEAEPNDFLSVRSIKRQIDGALGAHGAWLLEPYTDMPESIGLVLEPEAEIRRTAEIALQHGFQVNTHAIGDRANRRVLDLYEEVLAANGSPSGHRWRVEHAQHLHADDVPRFAQLGVIASMQGVHCTSDGPWVLKRLGEVRAQQGAYLWRELIDSGAVVTNGTDVPVEDIDPIASFYASVSRRMADGEAFYPQHRMTREEALRSYTVNNAYAAFEEDLKGSLEVGKLADLVVLSQDLLTVPEDEILDTRVDLTIVGGQIRYRRQDSGEGP